VLALGPKSALRVIDEAFVNVPVAGNKARFMLIDVRERAKAIHLEFEDVIFAVKTLTPNCGIRRNECR
jgi:hypothetical protein